MKRRGFLVALAAVPFLGRLVHAKAPVKIVTPWIDFKPTPSKVMVRTGTGRYTVAFDPGAPSRAAMTMVHVSRDGVVTIA